MSLIVVHFGLAMESLSVRCLMKESAYELDCCSLAKKKVYVSLDRLYNPVADEHNDLSSEVLELGGLLKAYVLVTRDEEGGSSMVGGGYN